VTCLNCILVVFRFVFSTSAKTFSVADECVYVFEYRDVCVRKQIFSSKQEIAN